MSTSNKPGIAELTTLCLACSCSLPPLRKQSNNNKDIYLTPCCRQPICPTCITANPRLARYNPCLSCLNGVAAVAARTDALNASNARNIDGGINDGDLFTVGSDDEDEEESQKNPLAAPSETEDHQPTLDSTPVVPNRYYIKKDDSLRGLALRFGISGLELCRLNTLPPSTLTTTPHILHTRQYLVMPASVSALLPSEQVDEEAEKAREARRNRERAEKRLQTLTKEVDWRVAKAYVAVAEAATSDPDELNLKRKEMDLKGDALEALAVDAYWEDEQWESEQKRVGKGVHIPSFPTSSSVSSSNKESRRGWFK